MPHVITSPATLTTAEMGLRASLTSAIAFAQIMNDGALVDRLLAIKRDVLQAQNEPGGRDQ